jgi:peptidoglycan-N-acetylglucosamine deacetylase
VPEWLSASPASRSSPESRSGSCPCYLLAADRLGYELVLWSLQMAESAYPGDPEGHARHIISRVVPRTILLAHDIEAAGGDDRKVAVDGLPMMITTLRAQGYEFVTVSELMRRSAAVG